MVPVTNQCIWWRFPSHSFRIGEKDLFAFGFRNQAWKLWYVVSCFRLSRSFKIPPRSLSVSTIKVGFTCSQQQAFGFSFNWLWSVVLRFGELCGALLPVAAGVAFPVACSEPVGFHLLSTDVTSSHGSFQALEQVLSSQNKVQMWGL